jgi:hypothetical protein
MFIVFGCRDRTDAVERQSVVKLIGIEQQGRYGVLRFRRIALTATVTEH